MDITFRPLASWPHADSSGNRRGYPFSATWSQTMNLLRAELGYLGAEDIIMGVCVPPSHIRRDGFVSADARAFHPGVELSFKATALNRPDRLTYATDACDDWQQNVRSIALGLQALRAVDRYGITRRSEQYAGFAAIASGGPDPQIGRKIVESAGSLRAALFKHHPDQGGDPITFGHVMAYKKAEQLDV